MPYALCSMLIALCLVLLPVTTYGESPISGFNPANLSEMSNGVIVDVRTFWGSNALPLRAIFMDEWDDEGPFKPRHTNRADVYWKTDAGVIYRGWRLAGFYRGELFMRANKDTVEIFRMLNLKQELPVGRQFDIDLSAKGFSARGIELSKGINLNIIIKGITAGITARYLKGEMIQEGTLTGNATPATPKTYDFDFYLDYIYDRNFIYKRKDTIPGYGDGYSFDFGIKYIYKEFSGEVLFRDILGRINWKEVPYTTADATSATKYYDKDGYMAFRPTIRGYESYKDFIQKIPLKTDISLTYKKDPFILSPTVNFIEGRPLYWIDIEYEAAKDLSFNIGYNINYKSVSIGTKYKKALLKAYANNLDLNNAMALGINLSLGLYF